MKTKSKFKKITIIVLSIMLIGLLGAIVALFGKSDFAKLKDKIKDNTQEEVVVASKNMVRNSNFQTNTTDIKVFNAENSGTQGDVFMDGWYNFDINFSGTDYLVYAVDNGLYIQYNSEGNISIGQDLETPEAVIGQTCTMSMSVNDVVYTKVISIIDQEWFTMQCDELSLAVIYNSTSTGEVSFVIKANQGFEGVVNWVQLELGDVFTGHAL